jgi:hypothetical protein
MDHLSRQLALAVRDECPEILRHVGLLSYVMKNFMQKDLSDGPGIVKPSSRTIARLTRDLIAIICRQRTARGAGNHAKDHVVTRPAN